MDGNKDLQFALNPGFFLEQPKTTITDNITVTVQLGDGIGFAAAFQDPDFTHLDFVEFVNVRTELNLFPLLKK